MNRWERLPAPFGRADVLETVWRGRERILDWDEDDWPPIEDLGVRLHDGLLRVVPGELVGAMTGPLWIEIQPADDAGYVHEFARALQRLRDGEAGSSGLLVAIAEHAWGRPVTVDAVAVVNLALYAANGEIEACPGVWFFAGSRSYQALVTVLGTHLTGLRAGD